MPFAQRNCDEGHVTSVQFCCSSSPPEQSMNPLHTLASDIQGLRPTSRFDEHVKESGEQVKFSEILFKLKIYHL